MTEHTHTHDPKWLLILRAVALVLGCLLMLVTLLGLLTAWQKYQEFTDLFEEASTSEPEEPVVEEPVFQEPEGWFVDNGDGTQTYCYEVLEPYELICEPVG